MTIRIAQVRAYPRKGALDANAAELMSEPDVDGALVGGASLKADSFAGIVTACATKE